MSHSDLGLALIVGYAAALVAMVALALWYGGREERMTAAILAAASLLTPLVQTADFRHAERGVIFIDLAVLLLLVALALRSVRFWPLFAAAFQLVGSASHLATRAFPELYGYSYATVAVFWSYAVIGAAAWGSWTYRDAMASMPGSAESSGERAVDRIDRRE